MKISMLPEPFIFIFNSSSYCAFFFILVNSNKLLLNDMTESAGMELPMTVLDVFHIIFQGETSHSLARIERMQYQIRFGLWMLVPQQIACFIYLRIGHKLQYPRNMLVQ